MRQDILGAGLPVRSKSFGRYPVAAGALRAEDRAVNTNNGSDVPVRMEKGRITVSLDPAPFRGELQTDDGRVRPFFGWLELAAAIQTLRKDAGHPKGGES
jgi:hypothetical protein